MSEEEKEKPDSDAVETSPIQNTILPKVRKVTGELGELTAMSAIALAGKPTDFRFAMDRDLGRMSTLFAEKWLVEEQRPPAAAELRAISEDLKRRADRSGYALLSEVCVLFGDYVTQVPPLGQSRDTIENYLNAILVISKKNLIGRGGMIGEQMIADLTKLNRKAGLSA